MKYSIKQMLQRNWICLLNANDKAHHEIFYKTDDAEELDLSPKCK
jgi:hypothetical protein